MNIHAESQPQSAVAPSFELEAELAAQQALSGHLAIRALEAYDKGDDMAFRQASEIHDETQLRIEELETVHQMRAAYRLRALRQERFARTHSMTAAMGASAISGIAMREAGVALRQSGFPGIEQELGNDLLPHISYPALAAITIKKPDDLWLSRAKEYVQLLNSDTVPGIDYIVNVNKEC